MAELLTDALCEPVVKPKCVFSPLRLSTTNTIFHTANSVPSTCQRTLPNADGLKISSAGNTVRGWPDVVIMNGVLTARLSLSVEAMTGTAEALVSAAFRVARVGIAFNMHSSFGGARHNENNNSVIRYSDRKWTNPFRSRRLTQVGPLASTNDR